MHVCMETGVSYTELDPDTDERFLPLRRAARRDELRHQPDPLRPGQRGRIHLHHHQEEVYIVLPGTLTLIVEGEARSGPGRARAGRAECAPARQPRTGGTAAARARRRHEHVGRDGEAFEAWDQETGAPPQEVPLPEDEPV